MGAKVSEEVKYSFTAKGEGKQVDGRGGESGK